MDIQHAETLPVFLAKMLVVHLVRPADGPHIGIPAPGEPFEALMDDDVMYHEISESIRHDTKTYGLHPPDPVLTSEHDQQHAGYGKYDEEGIILFEESGLHLVMILMQIPQKSMHHPFMRGPGDAFHEEESQEQNEDEIDESHNGKVTVLSAIQYTDRRHR